MRIILISGLWSYYNPVLDALRHEFRKRIPGAHIVEVEEEFCRIWYVRRMRRLIARTVKKYDDGTDALLVGHSMGGIFACEIARRMARSRVRGIATLCSPHRTLGPLLPLIGGSRQTTCAPVVSFHGTRDRVVRWGARHVRSISHHALDCDHWEHIAQDSDMVRDVVSKIISDFKL